MNAEELQAIQLPLKERYKQRPHDALYTLEARGQLGEGITCIVETRKINSIAGLHPATGGDGLSLCSGDMLLEALVACAGVTLKAVATAIGADLKSAEIIAKGVLDFRGTLAVSKEPPVGFKNITLQFNLESSADADQLETLIKLTERYCVVYQSLSGSPELSIGHQRIE